MAYQVLARLLIWIKNMLHILLCAVISKNVYLKDVIA